MGTKVLSAPKVNLESVFSKLRGLTWTTCLWLAFHVFLIAVLANHRDLRPVLFNRYSLSYGALLVAFAIIASVGIPITVRPQIFQQFSPRTLQSLRRYKLFHAAIYAFCLLLLLA